MKKKKTIGKIIPFLAILSLTSNVFAADALNSQTGAESTNKAIVSVENKTNIENQNNANIQNNICAVASTGNNSASYNTGNGSVSTGNAGINIDVENQVNQNTANLLGGENFNGSASNLNTGFSSKNYSFVSVKNEKKIKNKNDLDIRNKVNANADTGNNNADFNTGNGSVNTGDASINININNEGNVNEVGIGGAPGGVGGQPEVPGLGGAPLEAVGEILGMGGAGPLGVGGGFLPAAGVSFILTSILLLVALTATHIIRQRKLMSV